MSFPSAESFYSGSTSGPTSDQMPEVQQTASTEPPPYDRRVEQGMETFQPLPQTSDPNFQPEVAPVGPEQGLSISLPLIAAVAFGLWLLFKGDE